MKTLTTITLFLSVTLILGCGDTKKPKDMPAVFPCTVHVTQEGQPLGGAQVELIRLEGSAGYQPSAVGGADGAVVLKTYGYVGAPEGKYKVVVKKFEHEYSTPAAGDPNAQRMLLKSWQLVEEQYTKAETTPYEIEVIGKGKTEKTFDVGKAVKVLTYDATANH